MTLEAPPPSHAADTDVPPSQAEAMLAKGKATVEKLAGRIGLLLEACRRAGLEVPGAPPPGKQPVLSPKGEQVVWHVVAGIMAGGPLERTVPQVAARWFQCRRALEALAQALAEGRVSQARFEETRVALTGLARLPEIFRADPLLAEVFPAPPTQQLAPARPAPPPAPPAPRAPGPDEARLRRARKLLAHMEAHLDDIRLVLGMLDPNTPVKLSEFTSRRGTELRAMAQRLRRFPKEVRDLQAAQMQFGKLKRELEIRGAELSRDELDALVEPLATLVAGFHRTMVFGQIFAQGRQPTFD